MRSNRILRTGLLALSFVMSLFILVAFLPPVNASPNSFEGSTVTEVTLGPSGDSCVDASQPAKPRGGENELYTSWGGSLYPGVIHRALLRFDAWPIPSNAVIDSARLELYVRQAVGPFVPPDPVLVPYRIVSDWNEAHVTWNNQPQIGEAAVGSEIGVESRYYAWDVTTIARAWQSGPRYGIEIRGPESGSTWLRSFPSREKGMDMPRLVVTYRLPGTPTGTPTSRTPTPTRTVQSPTPTPTSQIPTPTGPARTSTPTLTPGGSFNLLENPGFEQQLNGWRVSSGSGVYAADGQVVRSGHYSARGTESVSGSLGRLYQDVTQKVIVGARYRISGWIKTEAVSGAAVIGLDYVNRDGWTPVGGYVCEIGYVGGTHDWTYYESRPFTLFGPPADASALWFLFDFNAGTGRAYWDDVALVPATSVYLPVVCRGSSHFAFDFKHDLFDEPSTLQIWLTDVNVTLGLVSLAGQDSRTTEFVIDWGDGQRGSGSPYQQHAYFDLGRNYVIRVTARYAGGTTDYAELPVRFVAPLHQRVPIPSWLTVIIPPQPVQLSSRLYAIPEGLTSFDDSFFRTVPRSAIEYLLSVGAQVQYEMVNGNIVLPNGNFNQVLLRDAGFQGMYSLWYTTPVSFGVGDYGFQDPIQYSSFLHEMGHNFTLNFPANYCYGGKIDGWANAIFSESMAQIFAHAAAFEIINQQGAYGLADDVVSELKSSARDSIRWVRRSYENYYEGGKRFHSWNDPSTPQDETFDTFMTIARQFFAHAEWAGEGYKAPTQRMMHLLALFNPELQQRYSQGANSPAAESFRASLLVAALSHAFSTDLRVEFRELGFPVDDAVYQQLLGMVQ